MKTVVLAAKMSRLRSYSFNFHSIDAKQSRAEDRRQGSSNKSEFKSDTYVIIIEGGNWYVTTYLHNVSTTFKLFI